MIINGLIGVNNGTVRDLVINSGEIDGGAYVGSVVGKNYGSIINCGNKVDVTGKDDWVGGICGQCYSGSIGGCFNSGDVIGNGIQYTESDVGGIVGSVRQGCSIYDCYNLGKVNGVGVYAGGIVGAFGWNGKITTSVERCFNMGEITSKAEYR